MKRRTAIWSVLFIAIAAGALTALTSTTNCGGNSYALSVCRSFALQTKLMPEDGKFEFAQWDAPDKALAVSFAKNHWIGGADFLVRTNFNKTPQPRLLVIVCEQSFANAPQPIIWNLYHRNPAHAVGYSDGDKGLISPEEFKALDMKDFAPLSGLKTNSLVQTAQP